MPGKFIPDEVLSGTPKTHTEHIPKSGYAGTSIDPTHVSKVNDTPSTSPLIFVTQSELPTQGKVYKEGVSIAYRPYYYGEIEKMSSSKNIGPRELLTLVLDGIQTTAIDKNNLCLCDVLFIGLLRKISVLGTHKIQVGFTCECGAVGKEIWEAKNIEFYDIEAEGFPIIASLKNKEVEFMPLTVGDMIFLIDHGNLDTSKIMAKQSNMPFNDAYEFFRTLPNYDDIETIQEVGKLLRGGLRPIKATCKVCSATTEIEMEDMSTLLLPFREREISPRSRIRFGSRT